MIFFFFSFFFFLTFNFSFLVHSILPPGEKLILSSLTSLHFHLPFSRTQLLTSLVFVSLLAEMAHHRSPCSVSPGAYAIPSQQ